MANQELLPLDGSKSHTCVFGDVWASYIVQTDKNANKTLLGVYQLLAARYVSVPFHHVFSIAEYVVNEPVFFPLMLIYSWCFLQRTLTRTASTLTFTI